ncbi:stage V sporulation protein D [Sporolactobacillus spathodeae]|uniref:Stage V sporulation protein D (Sporulation-specific penicillin-binding protein) n=1 Tax=Sporolactobacillus spathodeae TaxID=1465502 RepID=A0ABS2Q934_9BACL|nr:stage V sporulation protein D [Sporolactobacillus spathodeae]MBM7658293.1 stage V sporulation protein D (sporulation-specific penicillin-binding protein) [Sporolactobacillus spathodeae]
MRVSKVTVKKRLFLILTAGLCVFSIFITRLVYIQIINNRSLTDKALQEWGRDIPYEAERGNILDTNGKIIATNVSSPSVLVVPRQIQPEQRQATAKALAQILGMRQSVALEKITKNESIVRITPQGRKISNEKAAAIRSLALPGVFIAEDFKRYYPHGNFLAHVLGFTGIDNQGLTGLEAYYNNGLKGTNGHVSFYADVRGNRMKNLKDEYTPPVSGASLELTIDSRVQHIIERELDNAVAKYHPDNALAIAMDPNTGNVLGMSSKPDFNPEKYQTVAPEVYNRNLPIWKTYEPGSTFKVITLAAALQEKVVNLNKDHFYDSGAIEVAGTQLHCWKRGGHGSETFLQVVQNSCNPGFVALGERLGKQKLFSYIHKFGFGSKTGIDLQGEAKGILFNENKIGPLELATTAFGQGVSVTPIQQIAAVSAAVNGGVLYQPHLAKAWINTETGQTINRIDPVEQRRVISPGTSKQVRQALESVVALGTGRNAYVDGYRIGGKTGTAQKVDPKTGGYMQGNYILSFTGFAPANNPKIVVYVAIDNPKNTVQFGGTVSAPIAGKIIGDSLSAMGVPKQVGGLEKANKWPDTPPVEVPNLIGQKKDDLANDEYALKIKAVGSGNTIIMQSPRAGVKVKQGSTIMIYLGDKNKAGD